MYLEYVVEGPSGFKNYLLVGLLTSTRDDHGVRLCRTAFVDRIFQDFHFVGLPSCPVFHVSGELRAVHTEWRRVLQFSRDG